MIWKQVSGSLNLHNDFFIHKQIRLIITNDIAFILYLDSYLLRYRHTKFGKFLTEGIFIDLFQETIPQVIVNIVKRTDNSICFFSKKISHVPLQK